MLIAQTKTVPSDENIFIGLWTTEREYIRNEKKRYILWGGGGGGEKGEDRSKTI